MYRFFFEGLGGLGENKVSDLLPNNSMRESGKGEGFWAVENSIFLNLHSKITRKYASDIPPPPRKHEYLGPPSPEKIS